MPVCRRSAARAHFPSAARVHRLQDASLTRQHVRIACGSGWDAVNAREGALRAALEGSTMPPSRRNRWERRPSRTAAQQSAETMPEPEPTPTPVLTAAERLQLYARWAWENDYRPRLAVMEGAAVDREPSQVQTGTPASPPCLS